MGFEWQTREKDNAWGEGAPAAKRPGTVTWHHGWLLVLALALLLLVGAASFLLYRRGKEQIAVATAAISSDVLSSHDLVRRAAAGGDEELLVTVLSGRDPQWADAQRRLLRRDLLVGEAARLFGLHPLSPPAEAVDVTLSADLHDARVLATRRYTVPLSRDLVETVTLTQTLVFRRGRQRWLYAPPDEAFWGTTSVVREGRLSVTFPDRDRGAAMALAGDLNRILEEMCATTWVTCPGGRLVAVRLEPEPESLLHLADTDAAMTAGGEIALPTPSLVGWPAGEEACQALFRGYVSHILRATASGLLGYQCCQKALYHEALLDRLLSDLGVRAWPLTAEDYMRFSRNPAPMGRMDDFWRRPGIGRPPTNHERLQARAFVTFLEAVYGAPPGEQHRLLLEARGFWGWMREMSGVAVGQEGSIGEAWRRFLAEPHPEDFHRRFVYYNETLACTTNTRASR